MKIDPSLPKIDTTLTENSSPTSQNSTPKDTLKSLKAKSSRKSCCCFDGIVKILKCIFSPITWLINCFFCCKKKAQKKPIVEPTSPVLQHKPDQKVVQSVITAFQQLEMMPKENNESTTEFIDTALKICTCSEEDDFDCVITITNKDGNKENYHFFDLIIRLYPFDSEDSGNKFLDRILEHTQASSEILGERVEFALDCIEEDTWHADEYVQAICSLIKKGAIGPKEANVEILMMIFIELLQHEFWDQIPFFFETVKHGVKKDQLIFSSPASEKGSPPTEKIPSPEFNSLKQLAEENNWEGFRAGLPAFIEKAKKEQLVFSSLDNTRETTPSSFDPFAQDHEANVPLYEELTKGLISPTSPRMSINSTAKVVFDTPSSSFNDTSRKLDFQMTSE